MKNDIDKQVINDFGIEWTRFPNDHINYEIQKKIFNLYFSIFPKVKLNKSNIGYDMGCGSGRWAYFLAPLVKKIYCIEPSKAIYIAKKNLKKFNNCIYIKKNILNNNLKKNFFDFGYCLGVLHHIQDTQKGLNNCVKILKKNAPFLLYLYYNFENKTFIYKFFWYISNSIRFVICRLPKFIKYLICDFLAVFIYFPLAKLSLLFQMLGLNEKVVPLHFYKNLSFYHMRNDSLDRFGTKIEKRFSKKEIMTMMRKSGLKNIKFSNHEPFWCAIGYKK